MEYSIENPTKKFNLDIGSILQSGCDGTGVVYMIINMHTSSMGSYGLLSLGDLEIVDYANNIYVLVANYFEDDYTVLKQVEPIKLAKEV
jgi:hypothetical protein